MGNSEIPEYEREFVRRLFIAKALRFGNFTLKSGRKSPYFINMGDFNSGRKLRHLVETFAAFVHDLKENEEIPAPTYFFGPLYKGIGLALGSSMEYDRLFGEDVEWGVPRKEVKDHGDAGAFYGAVPKNGDKILIFDDVFTTGKTKEDAVGIIQGVAPEATICGVVIAANRCEVGPDEKTSAIGAFYDAFGIKTYSITDIYRITQILHNLDIDGKIALTDQNKAAIEEYLEKYGAKEVI